jgi:hypothetical protein
LSPHTAELVAQRHVHHLDGLGHGLGRDGARHLRQGNVHRDQPHPQAPAHERHHGGVVGIAGREPVGVAGVGGAGRHHGFLGQRRRDQCVGVAVLHELRGRLERRQGDLAGTRGGRPERRQLVRHFGRRHDDGVGDAGRIDAHHLARPRPDPRRPDQPERRTLEPLPDGLQRHLGAAPRGVAARHRQPNRARRFRRHGEGV